jgi:hypothetical protein
MQAPVYISVVSRKPGHRKRAEAGRSLLRASASETCTLIINKHIPEPTTTKRMIARVVVPMGSSLFFSCKKNISTGKKQRHYRRIYVVITLVAETTPRFWTYPANLSFEFLSFLGVPGYKRKII